LFPAGFCVFKSLHTVSQPRFGGRQKRQKPLSFQAFARFSIGLNSRIKSTAAREYVTMNDDAIPRRELRFENGSYCKMKPQNRNFKLVSEKMRATGLECERSKKGRPDVLFLFGDQFHIQEMQDGKWWASENVYDEGAHVRGQYFNTIWAAIKAIGVWHTTKQIPICDNPPYDGDDEE
jgi:hypothetical protein